MTNQRVFLLGGGEAAFEPVADVFVPAAGGTGAAIALLMQGGPDWESRYFPAFAEPWQRRGVTDIRPIVPDADGTLNLDRALTALATATGIFISGGDTAVYHRLFAAKPVRGAIRARFAAGAPVAGISAGALIIPQQAMLPPDESYQGGLEIVTGLGLLTGMIVGVHFTEWHTLPHVLSSMQQTQITTGWGIDEPVCALFEDGHFEQTLGTGGAAHQIRLTLPTDYTIRAFRATLDGE